MSSPLLEKVVQGGIGRKIAWGTNAFYQPYLGETDVPWAQPSNPHTMTERLSSGPNISLTLIVPGSSNNSQFWIYFGCLINPKAPSPRSCDKKGKQCGNYRVSHLYREMTKWWRSWGGDANKIPVSFIKIYTRSLFHFFVFCCYEFADHHWLTHTITLDKYLSAWSGGPLNKIRDQHKDTKTKIRHRTTDDRGALKKSRSSEVISLN